MTRADALPDERHRLDKWLWHVRLYKTRALAARAVTGGKVRVNGQRVKPAHVVRVGQPLSVSIGTETSEIEILDLPARRGPASEAQACYVESAASRERRATLRELQRIADLSRPRTTGRPDKRERRQIDRLRRAPQDDA